MSKTRRTRPKNAPAETPDDQVTTRISRDALRRIELAKLHDSEWSGRPNHRILTDLATDATDRIFRRHKVVVPQLA